MVFWFLYRYLQCADLSGGSAFELPQYQTAPNKDVYSDLVTHYLHHSNNDPLTTLGNLYLTKACQVDDAESHYLEIPNAEKANPHNKFVIPDYLPFSPTSDAKLPSLYLKGSTQEDQVNKEELTLHCNEVNEQLEHPKDTLYLDSTHEKYTQIENLKDGSFLNDNGRNENKHRTQNGKDKDTVQPHERTASFPNHTDNVMMPLFQTCKEQAVDASHKGDSVPSPSLMYSSPSSHSQLTNQSVTTELKSNSSLLPHHGVVVAIDNSNIYIGAQECASMVNAGDRKRHVRLKLQNLVRILERERTKTRGFACGSSPPATEHVWDVYR